MGDEDQGEVVVPYLENGFARTNRLGVLFNLIQARAS